MLVSLGRRYDIAIRSDKNGWKTDLYVGQVHAVYPTISQENLIKMSVNQIIGYDTRKFILFLHIVLLTYWSCKEISRILGTTKTIVAKDSKVFAKEIGKYIDSKDQKRGSKKDKDGDKDKSKGPSLMDKVRSAAGLPNRNTDKSKKTSKTNDPDAPALWPLIRQVNVRCHAEALSTGAVLVDLPGALHFILPSTNSKCECL
jgi:hypothetical protein